MQRDIASWIAGCMAENYEAVGFIPLPTVRQRYIARGHFILQCNERGIPVGYLLHGPLDSGRVCVVTQHVIVEDRRLHGYGMAAIHTLLSRCRSAGVSTLRLHCALDLPSLQFWRAAGFHVYDLHKGGRARSRQIASLAYQWALPLFPQEG